MQSRRPRLGPQDLKFPLKTQRSCTNEPFFFHVLVSLLLFFSDAENGKHRRKVRIVRMAGV